MRRSIVVLASTAIALAIALGGSPATGDMSAGGRTAAATDACAAYHPDLPDPSTFAPRVDNPYFPLPVGRTWVYRGVEGRAAQVDRVRVTSRTKTIAGIRATVVHDVLRHRGSLLEETFDWYAQDGAGNVWYLGEDTKAFDRSGHVDRSGSWQAGVDGAQPGLIMEADPRVPDAYRQECLAGQAVDMAWVVDRGGSTTVPLGRVHRTVRTFEFTPLEPTVVSEKRYAPGLGIVVERDLHGGDERFELVSVSG